MAEDGMAQLIWVASGRTDGRVVLWERHPAHPNGEAFVADQAPHQVAETAEVLTRLGTGQLVRVEAPDGESLPGAIVEAEAPAEALAEAPTKRPAAGKRK